MGDEIVIGDKFLDSLLSGDGMLNSLLPGGWHDGFAPQRTPAPFGVYDYVTARPVYARDELPEGGLNPLQYFELRYRVTAADENPTCKFLEPAATRIRGVIGSKRGMSAVTVPGGQVLWIHYAGPFALTIHDGGRSYSRLGSECVIAVRDEIVCGT